MSISSRVLGASLLLFLAACGDKPVSRLHEAWDSANDPDHLNQIRPSGTSHYLTEYAALPLSAELPQRPWTDDYWPSYQGGLSFRWNAPQGVSNVERYGYPLPDSESLTAADLRGLSPAEKYDLYLNHKDFPLTRSERDRTAIMRTVPTSSEYDASYSIPSWEGLCHAWAPATLAFKEPHPVTLTNADGLAIPFGSSDVKALLTYFLHMAPAPDVQVIGRRCDLDFDQLRRDYEIGLISKEDFDYQVNTLDCRDTNAGAFHIALANQIGIFHEGFIADVTRDYQVWNQPIYGYESTLVSRSDQASPGAAKGTVKEVTLHTVMDYIEESDARWETSDVSRNPARKAYDYRLELDAEGRIIGGEWLSEDRPDFIWKQSIPTFEGYFEDIGKIYRASLATDGERL